MVVKVSISLLGKAVITLEASEAAVLHEVVSLALRELPRELVRIGVAEGTSTDIVGNGKKVLPANEPVAEEPVAEVQIHSEDLNRAEELNRADDSNRAENQNRGTATAEPEDAFARFCHDLSPMGDMRRTVVAAESARRHLGMDGVSEEELGLLFDRAGWRRPSDFVQTLRNAARSKFQWLERVPGTKGYYAVTAAGKRVVSE